MDEELLKQRTKQFVLRIIRLIDALPKNQTAKRNKVVLTYNTTNGKDLDCDGENR